MTEDKDKEKNKQIKSDANGNEWRYECYICGIRVLGKGEMVRQCNCKHVEPKKILNWDEIKSKLG